MTPGRRTLVGVLAVTLFVLSTAIVFAPVRTADTGMTLQYILHGGAKRTVEKVVPGGAAARAGLANGDVVDLGRSSLNDRLALYWQVSPSDVPVQAERAGHQFVARVSLRTPVTRIPPWAIAMTVIINVIYLALVFLLLRDAAHRPEARFLLGWILAQLANNDYYLIFAPTGLLAYIGAALTPITAGFLYYYIARFVLAVPNRDSPLEPFFRRLIPFIIGLYAVCDVVLPSVANLLPAWDFGRGSDSEPLRLLWYGDILALLLIVSIIVDGLIHTARAQRVQLQWVASTVLLVVAIEMTRAVFYLTAGAPPTLIDTVAYPLESITVLGASYAVLRYHLIDLELIVSRAAVFAAVSAILVAAFIVAEWIVAKLAERALGSVPVSVIEQYSGLVAALVAGLLARYVHAFVDRSLNRLFFRGQYRNEEALMQFAREADAAPDAETLAADAFAALRKWIPASYVALVLRSRERYRCANTNHPLGGKFFEDSSIVTVLLRKKGRPFEIEDPRDELYRAMIFPMVLLGHVVAFIVCGPKADRTRYGDREVAVIENFAQRVGASYAWLCGGRLES